MLYFIRSQIEKQTFDREKRDVERLESVLVWNALYIIILLSSQILDFKKHIRV